MISIERDGAVQIIRMDRVEKKNALTQAMYMDMAEALKTEDEGIRCHVMLGRPGVFTAGNDIADFLKAAMSGDGLEAGGVGKFLGALHEPSRPVIAGIDGPAIGVGTTMLFHFDMVYATENALFKTPFTDLGIIPEAGSTLIGPETMGYHKAFELLALGENFTAEMAKEAGFVNHVVSPDELEERVIGMAQKVAAKPQNALRISRELLRGKREPLEKRIYEEIGLFAELLKSDEAREAFMKFMSKA
ncbi:crotonase/enoyl-CoA hydratase family protein [Pseudovibrio brasiliensis]|uniref:Crotonase/enoyl-CoA hydratase family protein n=1 Tax=Pseudovibrio brasiliensis TaxID=1898042 RepID=A0ABX8APG4_9HYPH|nr:crotonase/enoyl-CoA hydratase family protein [Pseudovibrio brasiliensis]QUS56974.1 crotonase/enoyl-CoA hydratase family protein [Pseudovibrio brasiliensis]